MMRKLARNLLLTSIFLHAAVAADAAGQPDQKDTQPGQLPMACECRDDPKGGDWQYQSTDPDKDQNAGTSPYESCRRQGNRSPGCYCRCDPEVERMTGPYGDRQKKSSRGGRQ